MTSIELSAPAKVNLFLKVLNKRKDSYHNILTIFERISLVDKVRISKISKGIVVSSDRFITRNPKENLAYKAARAILNKRRLNSGVKIEIKKNIPVGGGLGGGSSDAAAVLIGINRLFNLKFKRMALMRLASRLGADVPFFISRTPFAIGRSRGDRLEVINSRKCFWHLLIHPGFRLSTEKVYKAFDAELLSNPSTLRQAQGRPEQSRRTTGSGFDPELIEGSKCLTLRHSSGSSPELSSKDLTRRAGGVKIRFPFARSMDFDTVESMLYNDLEDITRSKNDIIDRIIKRLAYHLGKKAIVSGSGPSLFCLYRTRKEATRDRDVLLKSVLPRERKSWRVFVVKTMD